MIIFTPYFEKREEIDRLNPFKEETQITPRVVDNSCMAKRIFPKVWVESNNWRSAIIGVHFLLSLRRTSSISWFLGERAISCPLASNWSESLRTKCCLSLKWIIRWLLVLRRRSILWEECRNSTCLAAGCMTPIKRSRVDLRGSDFPFSKSYNEGRLIPTFRAIYETVIGFERTKSESPLEKKWIITVIFRSRNMQGEILS